MIPLPNYEPDRPDFAPDASDAFLNALPVKDGWGPFPRFVAFSDALPSACKGAVIVRLTNGTTRVYAGTSTGLYRLSTTDATWTDVSRVSGGDYAVPSGEYWSFELFGNELIAVNGNDDPQVIDVDSGANFDALGGSPAASRYAAGVGFQLLLASQGSDPLKFALSGVSEPGFWTPFQRGSDSQVLTEGGWIQGAVGDQSGAFIFQQDRIVRLSLTYDIATFRVDEFESARGAVAPGSIIRIGKRIFFKSEDGFYLLGQPSQPIGFERVDRFLEAQQNLDFVSWMQGAADPVNKRVFWRYWRAVDASTDHSGGLLIYDWGLDRWARSELDLEYILPAATQGYSLDGLGSGGLGYTVDTLPYPFDSRVWQGGRPVMAAFNSEHKLGFFSGTNQAATLETADMSLAGEHRRAFVQGFRPVCDADGLSGQVAFKDTIGGARAWNTAASQDVTGLIPARVPGRQHRFRVSVPAGAVWEHCVGIEPLVRPAGVR